MLQALQELGKELGRDLVRGWESLTDGWRELLSRSAVVDNGHELVVRIEVPGVDRADCEIVVEGNTLIVRGEKRYDSTYVGGSYHIRQCAYGVFQRVVPLPFNVHAENADAQFRNGVLVVRLPKAPEAAPRRIQIH